MIWKKNKKTRPDLFVKRHNSRKGFTLLELLMTFVVLGIIAGLGVRTFSSYQKKQVLEQAALDFKATLEDAKFRSVSRVKPSACLTNPITHYEVSTTGTNTYRVRAVCTLTNDSSYTLPSGTSFNLGNCTVTYPLLSSSVTWTGSRCCIDSDCHCTGAPNQREFCVRIQDSYGNYKKVFLDHGGTVKIE